MCRVARLLLELPFDELDERALEGVGPSRERAREVAGEEFVRGVGAHGRSHAPALATGASAQVARVEAFGGPAGAVDEAGVVGVVALVVLVGELADSASPEAAQG